MNASTLLLFVGDASSPAYRAGVIVGGVLGLVMVIGVFIFGVVAVVNAFTKRTAGWVVAGSICGLLLLMITGLFLFGFTKGFKRGWENRSRNSADSSASERVTGEIMPYTIERPSSWQLERKKDAFDLIVHTGRDYVGVIAEEVDLGAAENVVEMVKKRIQSVGTESTTGSDEPITIDGRKWIAFTTRCKVQNVPFAYQFYVYSGPEGTIQIFGWTFQNLWERESPKLREVMQTFRFPVAKTESETKP